MEKKPCKKIITASCITVLILAVAVTFQCSATAAPGDSSPVAPAAPAPGAVNASDISGTVPPAAVYQFPVPAERQVRVYRMDEASLLNTQIHDIASQLIENSRGGPDAEGIVGVATFVDLNNLYRTSPFGRYLAEQLMGELQRAGFRVVEVRKTESLLIKEHYGEYSMSREIEEIARQTSAHTILLGTYLVRGGYVFVNARLVTTGNSMVASSGMKIMRMSSFLKKMLWPAAAPQKSRAVRIPVKAFGEPTEVRIIQGS